MSDSSKWTAPEDLIVTEIFRSARRSMKAIIITAVIIGILGALVGMIQKSQWTAVTRILPPQNQSGGVPFDLGGLGSLAGIRLNGSGSVNLYPAIFRSNTVLAPIISASLQSSDSTNVTLMNALLGDDTPITDHNKLKALTKLRRAIHVTMDRKSDVVTMTVTLPDRLLSANVANTILKEAELYHQKSSSSQASLQRIFIEGRLSDVLIELGMAENDLLSFREQNRDFSSSPLLQLEYERRTRNVAIQTAVYTELRKQIEMAKVEESRNLPVLRILDKAVPPLRPSSGPVKTALTFFLLGSALSTIVLVIRDMNRKH